jgi:hypothetical protein
VRYDGTVTACCNERVIMGHGPDRLRHSAASEGDVTEALGYVESDTLLKTIRDIGASTLTELPPLADLAARSFSSICDLCWELQERAGDPAVSRWITALGAVTTLECR